MRYGVAFFSSMTLAAAVTWGACGSRRPSPADDGPNGGSGSGNGGSSSTGFVSDGAAICGNDVHQPVTHPPLVYFVLDRSGSMEELATPGGASRWTHVVDAAVSMVDQLGALVRTGPRCSPHPNAEEGQECIGGTEVYSPKIGASPSAFRDAIDIDPFGGTPVSATLEALLPEVLEVEGPRAVILATDGAPNCNPNISCGADQCMVNIVGQCPPDIENCCDPAVGGIALNCVDRVATVLAVQALANAGVDVYVVGIPGSEQFSAVLDQLAVVGGVPQEGADDYYYRVDDVDTLADVFRQIGASLVSCTYDLADPPDAPGKTNVYFDASVVLQDADNGWVWVDEDTIQLVGAACDQLKTGNVSEVQIVSGCPTETPR
ncbi:MAG: VWA domain-containing protein [Polyangiaceae bacterium]|nr:VWA domain-containing protein [Polyangiaceae bacterium]